MTPERLADIEAVMPSKVMDPDAPDKVFGFEFEQKRWNQGDAFELFKGAFEMVTALRQSWARNAELEQRLAESERKRREGERSRP